MYLILKNGTLNSLGTVPKRRIILEVKLENISTNLLRTIKEYSTIECSFELETKKMGGEEYYETLHNKFR